MLCVTAFSPRAGVYHPDKTIKPLPPVPGTKSGVARTPLDRKKLVAPVKPKSSRTTPVSTSAGGKKEAAAVIKSGKRIITPRLGSQLISSYKNNSPKSFAPKNFQFNLQVGQPQPEPAEESAVPAATPVRSSRRVSYSPARPLSHPGQEGQGAVSLQGEETQELWAGLLPGLGLHWPSSSPSSISD